MASIRIMQNVVRGRTAIIIILAVMVYFNLGLLTLLLLGVDPNTTYYIHNHYGTETIITVLLLNLIYVTAAAIFLRRMIPGHFVVSIYSSRYILLAAIAAILYINASNFGLSRDDIKSSSNFISVFSASVAYSYLASLVLCETNKLNLAAAVGTLLFAVAASYERELILYLLVPLALRLDRGKLGLFKTGSVIAVGVIAITLYKYVSSLFRYSSVATANATGGFDILTRIKTSLIGDNLHKGFLELSYFTGQGPDYTRFSYFVPVQLERLLNPGAQTNGQIATYYYTGGNTGTGFSALLEAWLNLSAIGIIVLPLLIALGVQKTARSGSAFLFIAATIFILKLQRSDLWPTMIGYLLGPLLIYACWRLVRKPGRPRTISA